MSASELLHRFLDDVPLIAIIRGVRPDEAEAIGDAIQDGGIRIVEVPLNSPDPLRSIEALARRFGHEMLVGAGTVLDPADVTRVRDAGGRIIVSPDSNSQVISAAVQAGLISAPGYFTPSEAFTAVRSGAHALKLFPAEATSPAVLTAQLAVLPKDIPVLIVGGIRPDNMQPWLAAGARGFGLGGGLYKAGQTAPDTLAKAKAYVGGLRA
jgi:2-dehydro-3-deoxyphosphogalactonate aldolase